MSTASWLSGKFSNWQSVSAGSNHGGDKIKWYQSRGTVIQVELDVVATLDICDSSSVGCVDPELPWRVGSNVHFHIGCIACSANCNVCGDRLLNRSTVAECGQVADRPTTVRFKTPPHEFSMHVPEYALWGLVWTQQAFKTCYQC